MKKFIVLLCISVFFLIPVMASAQDSSTGSSQIEDLKERLATKVAELRQTQKKAISGTVKSVSISTVTIETLTSDIKIELTDTIQVFQTINGKRTELTTDDLAKGDSVVVFGDYDSTIELLKAKVIVIQDTLPVRVSGTITGIDKLEFTVTVQTTDGPTYTIDIEKNTSMLAYIREEGIVKGGFSKLETGSIAHIVGKPVPKEDNRVSAVRFLDIGVMNNPTPTPTPESASESTGSAKTTTTPKGTATPAL
jgi:hypothetical protein